MITKLVIKQGIEGFYFVGLKKGKEIFKSKSYSTNSKKKCTDDAFKLAQQLDVVFEDETK